jgi:hypothetical protein
MTLTNYTAGQLDQLALRLLEIAAIFREMAVRSREQEVEPLPLHDRKAQEWCDKLEHWARRAQAEMDVKMRMARAARRAQAIESQAVHDRT